MQTVTIQPATPQQDVLRCWPVRVFVAGQRRHDLAVKSWSVLPGPEFGHVKLMLQSPVSEAGVAEISDYRKLPAVGSRIIIKPQPGSGAVEFQGVVTAHVVKAGGENQELLAEVEHYLSDVLAKPIAGRWQSAVTGAAWVENAKLKFNMTADSFASPITHLIGERAARVFDDSDESLRWTVADALSYLIAAEFSQADLAYAPDDDELQFLAGGIDLGEYNGTGKTLPKVFCDIAHRGGLAVRACRFGRGLVVYKPGTGGRRGKINLQPAGQSLNCSKTNLYSAKISFNRRPSQPPIRVIGGIKQYESTFELQPGWDSSLETDDWRDFVRSDSEDWLERSRVFRTWVLNEHGQYNDIFGLSTHDFSDISTVDFTARKARVFMPCLSLDEQGHSLGVVIETRTSPSGTWQRWPGAVWVSETECTITLGGDALTGDFFDAAVAHQAEVRVTATIESDTYINFEIPGASDRAWEISDLSGLAGYEAIVSESVFYNGTGASRIVVRDDTPMLAARARNLADIISGGTEATVELGWVDTSWSVGDIIERIEGRRLELSARIRSHPHVVAVHHKFGRQQQTQLIITG